MGSAICLLAPSPHRRLPIGDGICRFIDEERLDIWLTRALRSWETESVIFLPFLLVLAACG